MPVPVPVAATVKVALAPHADVLVSYIHAVSQQGDHGGGTSSLVNDTNNPNTITIVFTDNSACIIRA